jgi:hypothetical protein
LKDRGIIQSAKEPLSFKNPIVTSRIVASSIDRRR